MRGSIRQRGKRSWRITLEFGYVRDPETGTTKRVQKFITFHGTKRKAQDRLTDLLSAANHGEFVEPSKMTLGEWLKEWLGASVETTVPAGNVQPIPGHYRAVPAQGRHRMSTAAAAPAIASRGVLRSSRRFRVNADLAPCHPASRATEGGSRIGSSSRMSRPTLRGNRGGRITERWAAAACVDGGRGAGLLGDHTGGGSTAGRVLRAGARQWGSEG